MSLGHYELKKTSTNRTALKLFTKFGQGNSEESQNNVSINCH